MAAWAPSSEERPAKWFPENERSEWFYEHYHEAARQIINFFRGDRIGFEGKVVGDVGCGDGIIDLGIFHKTRPRSLVGFDLRPTDTELLRTLGREHGVLRELPPELEFRRSSADFLPAEDGSFDFMYSWSVFEHVDDPASLAKEIRRVLRPNGVLMIQLYPFFHSQHGSHLWPWYPEGFAQFLYSKEQIVTRVRSDPGPDSEWAEALLWEYKHLNQITLDGLQEVLRAGGLSVLKLEILSETVRVPAPVTDQFPLSQVGISGVKLLAVPV